MSSEAGKWVVNPLSGQRIWKPSLDESTGESNEKLTGRIVELERRLLEIEQRLIDLESNPKQIDVESMVDWHRRGENKNV